MKHILRFWLSVGLAAILAALPALFGCVRSASAAPLAVAPVAGVIVLTPQAVTLVGASGAVIILTSWTASELYRYLDLRPPTWDKAYLIALSEMEWNRLKSIARELAKESAKTLVRAMAQVVNNALRRCGGLLRVGIDGSGDYRVDRYATIRAPATLDHSTYLPPGRYTKSATWGLDLNGDGWAETRVTWGANIQFRCS